MNRISTLATTSSDPAAPSGAASLRVRERYLRRRSQRRRLSDRGMTALWLGAAAMVSWLFAVGFATLGH
jgi:hypothetical protein